MALLQYTTPEPEAQPSSQKVPFRRPLTRLCENEHIPRYIACDIETGIPGENPLGGTLVAVAWCELSETDELNNPVVHIRRTVADWCDALFSRRYQGATWVAHNGGEFDYKWLIEYLVNDGKQRYDFTIDFIARNDGRVIGLLIKHKKRVIRLIDSFALVPTSLHKLTQAFSPTTTKRERQWKNADGTINYFSLDIQQDVEYLRMDVLSLAYSLQKIHHALYSTFNCNVRITAASTALAAWRSTLPEHTRFFRQSPKVEAFCRKAYRGGCVFLTSTSPHENMVHLDVNAMYAWSMKQGVPDGTAFTTDTYEQGFAGFYECMVEIPENEPYPILGYDLPHGGSAWATGRFTTTITSKEVEYGLSQGWKINVLKGIVFSDYSYHFSVFLDKCEEIEKAHKKDAQGVLAKLLRNSLYGKFGSRDTITKLTYSQDDVIQDGVTPVTNRSTGEIVTGFYESLETLDAPYIQPHWAAWITATARLELNRLARITRAIYGDTDSIVCTQADYFRAACKQELSIGRAYGQLKCEALYEQFQCGGPKNYQALLSFSEYVDKAKGIPHDSIRSDDHSRALQGSTTSVEYVSSHATRQVILQGKPKIETRTRSYSRLENSRSWRQMENGMVRPIHIR